MKDRLNVVQCHIDLHVENSHSLKEKRRIIKSLKDRIKNQYNVAICEYGDLSLWQRAQLGLVSCSNEKNAAEATLKMAIDMIGHFPAVAIIDYRIEVI
ncbi:hypothetical protein A2Y85_04465 [candidate division WOR-3 bacterium RBG_13_43_14]|uniref:DUF503 domain-containing protein n=1 Tax=candidate division WOR-3 bacterium RBG_13_43_14 TaxID=1802590 RepID=A0A1F4U2N3_UNCW3|nr:MAG: hypothetical protein A2Y85_04465 [candidate division WOR-3 bacterium RBG_13_43_14]